MEKIKVLLVDDSAVIRKVLKDVLTADPNIEVIGTAANGKIALEQIALLKPDIITLDIEMPEMDGLETIKELRKSGSKVPVIMCSSLTAAGASHTLDALAFGASDYVTKPSSHGANTRDVVGEELIRKIKSLTSQEPSYATNPAAGSAELAVTSQTFANGSAPEVIAIGVSTGGPVALQELLPHLPTQLNIPILIVQHMPPVFTKLLAERLSLHSKMPVVEAQHGDEVKAGTIYLAPGGFHMEVQRRFGKTSIVLNEGPMENSCRPAVDVLFRSVASVYGATALAIMLTGMGQDGLLGCQRIKEAGGIILAQDRASSAVWGMPGAVVEAGLADAQLPLGALPSHIKTLLAKASPGSPQREQRV